VTAAKILPRGQSAPAGLSACVQKAATGWTVEGIEPGAKVILPFSFQQQSSQFVSRRRMRPSVCWARVRPARPSRARRRDAPFTVKVLADEINVRVSDISLTQLNIGPASRVAMHRHPRSGKVLYLLKAMPACWVLPGWRPSSWTRAWLRSCPPATRM